MKYLNVLFNLCLENFFFCIGSAVNFQHPNLGDNFT